MAELVAMAVRMTAIDKRFGAVAANVKVDLRVAVGTVHGIPYDLEGQFGIGLARYGGPAA